MKALRKEDALYVQRKKCFACIIKMFGNKEVEGTSPEYKMAYC
jgi:hypothetical protein